MAKRKRFARDEYARKRNRAILNIIKIYDVTLTQATKALDSGNYKMYINLIKSNQ